MNGTISFENNGYTVRIKDIDILTDGTQLAAEIVNERNFNWSAFQVNDDLWYEDGSKSVKCIGIDREEKRIVFKAE